jgi:hypothetical protein
MPNLKYHLPFLFAIRTYYGLDLVTSNWSNGELTTPSQHYNFYKPVALLQDLQLPILQI